MPDAQSPHQHLRGYGNGARGFNIMEFEAHRSEVGILRQHDFHVEIPVPFGLQGKSPPIFSKVELACDSINFPATALQTYPVQRYSYGAMETKPTMPTFSNLECTFMADQEGRLWKFFHDWIRLISNFDFGWLNETATGLMNTYEISYTQEYVVDMFLYIYNPHGQQVRKICFRHAYPIAVADVPLNWGIGNSIIKIPVSFTFVDWSEVGGPELTKWQPTTALGGRRPPVIFK